MATPPALRGLPLGLLSLWLWAGATVACDKDSAASAGAPEAAAAPAPAPAAPEPPRAPDIVVDSSNVTVGTDRVATGEPGLADRVGVFLGGRPMIENATVSVVAMRAARPSPVVAVVTALRKARAAAVSIRTEARDGTTQKLPVAFSAMALDCATVAWIAGDAAIDVWPAGGGTARRVVRGLAGPDMTLGMEAVQKQQGSCASSQIYVGADDALTWGLVFDLATAAVGGPGARTSAAVLVGRAVPGRKLVLE